MTHKMQSVIGASQDSLDIFYKNLVLNGVSFSPGTTALNAQANLKESGMPKDGTITTGDMTLTLKFPSDTTTSTTFVFAIPGTVAANLEFGGTGIKYTAKSAGTTVAGTINVGQSNLICSGTDIYVEWQFTTVNAAGNSVTLRIPNGTTVANVGIPVVCKLTEYASVLAATKPEDYFKDDFVNLYKQLNFGIFRPMGWTNPNGGSGISFTSQSKYIPSWNNSINHKSGRWIPGAWAGGTTSGNNAYVVPAPADISGSSPVDGETVQCFFTNALVGTNPTIQIGSRSAKPLLDWHNFLNPIASISANQSATLCYNRVLGGYIMAKLSQSAAIPYELQAAFANLINADLWVTVPFWFDDASTTAVATIVKNKLDPGLRAHFAYNNEVWNNGFDQTSWAQALGTAIGWPGGSDQNLHGWYALRSRQMFDLIEAAWAPRSRSELVLVLEWQAFASFVPVTTSRLEGAQLHAASAANYASLGYADYTAVGNRPIDKCDAGSYATYYSGGQCTNFDANYTGKQTIITVNGATPANPIVLQTSAAHSYSSGDRVQLSTFAGTGWVGLNNQNVNVTVIDSTHFSVPIDGSTFSSYVFGTNAGGVRRYHQMSGLLGAADDYASGDATRMASALAWMDNDVRAGTSYGVLGSQTLLGLNSVIYDTWDAYMVAKGKPINCYEGGFECWYPSSAACATLGVDSSYADAGGKIDLLLQGYKQTIAFQRLAEDQRTQFLSRASSGAFAWLIVNAASQWSLQSGDIYTTKWKSFDAIALFNNNKRRLVLKT